MPKFSATPPIPGLTDVPALDNSSVMELDAVPGPQALDLPVQLLEQQVHPVEQVLHQPLGDVGAPRQHRSLDLLHPVGGAAGRRPGHGEVRNHLSHRGRARSSSTRASFAGSWRAG